MTDTERQLLAACRSDPNDDSVRLVYADFLQDSDDACERCRGQWLVKALTQRGEGVDFEWQRIPHRFHTGFRALPEGWDGYFDRGFCVSVRCTLAAFEAGAAAVFERQPLIAAVELTDRVPFRLFEGTFGWFTNAKVWNSSTHDDELPPQLLRCFPEGRQHNYECAVYGTEVEAVVTLSTVCVRWGLKAAGWPLRKAVASG